MKRQLLIEIDAEDTPCGQCPHSGVGYKNCSIFDHIELSFTDSSGDDTLRCPQCREAEKTAKSLLLFQALHSGKVK